MMNLGKHGSSVVERRLVLQRYRVRFPIWAQCCVLEHDTSSPIASVHWCPIQGEPLALIRVAQGNRGLAPAL